MQIFSNENPQYFIDIIHGIQIDDFPIIARCMPFRRKWNCYQMQNRHIYNQKITLKSEKPNKIFKKIIIPRRKNGK